MPTFMMTFTSLTWRSRLGMVASTWSRHPDV